MLNAECGMLNAAERRGSSWRLPKNGQNAVDNEGEKNQKKPD
jgi:hypothetical protein